MPRVPAVPLLRSRLLSALEGMPSRYQAKDLPGLLRRHPEGVPGWEIKAAGLDPSQPADTEVGRAIAGGGMLSNDEVLRQAQEMSPVARAKQMRLSTSYQGPAQFEDWSYQPATIRFNEWGEPGDLYLMPTVSPLGSQTIHEAPFWGDFSPFESTGRHTDPAPIPNMRPGDSYDETYFLTQDSPYQQADDPEGVWHRLMSGPGGSQPIVPDNPTLENHWTRTRVQIPLLGSGGSRVLSGISWAPHMRGHVLWPSSDTPSPKSPYDIVHQLHPMYSGEHLHRGPASPESPAERIRNLQSLIQAHMRTWSTPQALMLGEAQSDLANYFHKLKKAGVVSAAGRPYQIRLLGGMDHQELSVKAALAQAAAQGADYVEIPTGYHSAAVLQVPSWSHEKSEGMDGLMRSLAEDQPAHQARNEKLAASLKAEGNKLGMEQVPPWLLEESLASPLAPADDRSQFRKSLMQEQGQPEVLSRWRMTDAARRKILEGGIGLGVGGAAYLGNREDDKDPADNIRMYRQFLGR